MKLKEFIENANTATKKIEFLLDLLISGRQSLHTLDSDFFNSLFQEIAIYFARLEPVIDKYGKRTITYQNQEIDLLRETLAIYDRSKVRIAELCIAEFNFVIGKLSVIYNNDMEAEIDLS